MRFVAHTTFALASLVALAGCVYDATEVQVVVDTDIDPSVPLTLRVRASRSVDGGAEIMAHTFERVAGSALRDAGTDARAFDAGTPDAGGALGVTYPFHFLVIPGDGPHDGTAHLFIEANAGGLVFRRHNAFAFVPRHRLTLPVFLSNRCALAAPTGCASGATCTQAQHCEEIGQTCGNDGACVPVETQPVLDGDASFGDVRHPLGPCGTYGEACCPIGAACGDTLSCVAGRCQRCLDPEERCCSGAELRPDGTACGDAPDACHRAPSCTAGVCGAPVAVPDGTECAATSDPCKRPGVCGAGACGALTNAPDGTQCAAPVNECHAASTCAGGACRAGAAKPDGTAWGGGGVQRCCGGNPVRLDTTSNCNACGLACRAGPCNWHPAVGAYVCSCTGANSGCSPMICRLPSYPDGNTCTPSDGNGNCTNVCPNGSRCHQSSGEPNYCYYP